MDIRISPDVVLARERGRPRRGIFVFLAVAVALITVVLLINPATTQEYEPVCGLEEHEHTEECTEIVRNLICPLEESGGHVHGEECYEVRPVLTCPLEENEEHQHTDECFTEQKVLICTLPEGQVHEHTEDCIMWEETYICGLEDDPEHEHTDECVERVPVFICQAEAGVGHIHNDFCYEEETVYTCGLAAHVHTDDCYPQLTGDPHADVEIDLDWESTFCNVELTGIWSDDLIAIARSQAGYHESELNFVTDEYNVRHGYTRYGDWNGTRYSGWNGLYVMFCLHYAGVRNVPADPVPANWMNSARAQGFWTEREDLPAPGDLAFFDDDADGLADRVAIVTAVWEDGFDMISGGTGKAVEEEPVSFGDEKLAGYLALPQNPDYITLEDGQPEGNPEGELPETPEGELPETLEGGQPEEGTVTLERRSGEEMLTENRVPLADPEAGPYDPYAPVTLRAETENGVTATMEAAAGSFIYPAEELVLTITEVMNGEDGAEAESSYNSAVQSIDSMLEPDGMKAANTRLFDISIWHKEYEEIPPAAAPIPETPDEPLPVPDAAEEALPMEETPEAAPADPVIPEDIPAPGFENPEGLEIDGLMERIEPGDMLSPSADELTVRSEIMDADLPLPADEPAFELNFADKGEAALDGFAEERIPEEIPVTERPFTLVEILPAGPVQVTVEGIGTEDWTDCRVYRIDQYGEVTELAPDATRPGSVTVTTEIN
ncbi:MAG: hypothetical protein II719_05945 [Clostridia bacterium]|nr:hypothetical protein [Clostridia bacterium]